MTLPVQTFSLFPGNDATLSGWTATAGYVAAALSSWVAARRSSGPRRCTARQERYFWLSAAIFMAAMAANKQLDLQTLLTDMLREQARHSGWYEQRRAYQLLFLQTSGAVLGTSCLALLWLVRRQGIGAFVGAAGLICTAAFVAIRAASFHHHDVVGRLEVVGIRLHVLLEFACIGLVCLGALLARSRRRGRRISGKHLL